MKKFRIPNMLLVGLLVLAVATAALAGQARLVSFTSAHGHAQGDNNGGGVIVGQGIAGNATHVAGNFMGRLGAWQPLHLGFLSPVSEETPVVRNHLFRNYPNPFNPSTRISFSLAKEAKVRIEVFDLKGRRVDTLLHEVRPAGAHSVTYEPKTLASGVYLVLLRAGSFRASQRMMLVK